MLKQIFKQSFAGFAIFTLGKVLNIATFILFGRILTGVEFGELVFLFTAAQIIIFISDFGTGNWYLKNTKNLPNTSSTIIYMRLTIALILATFVYALVYFWSKTPLNIWAYYTIIALEIVSAQIDNHYSLRLRQYIVGLRYFTKMAGALVFVAISHFYMDLTLPLTGYFFGLLANIILFIPSYSDLKFKYNTQILTKANLKEMLQFGYINFLSLLYSKSDSFLLGSIGGAGNLSIYSAAYRIYDAVALLPQTISQNLYVRMSKNMQETQKHIYRIAVVNFFIGVVLSILIFGFGTQIFNFAYGNKFSGADSVLMVLSLIIPLTFASSPLVAQIMHSQAALRWFKPFATVNTLLNIGLNLFLIPRMGFIGSAIAFMVTETTGFCINLCIYQFKARK